METVPPVEMTSTPGMTELGDEEDTSVDAVVNIPTTFDSSVVNREALMAVDGVPLYEVIVAVAFVKTSF